MTTRVSSRRRVLLMAGAGLALAPASALVTGCAQGGMGSGMSGAAAGASGDAFQMLAADHRRVDALFQQALNTTDAEAERRVTLLGQLKEALTRHALAEENVIYPTLRLSSSSDAAAAELYREHADVKTHLFALEQMPKGNDAWRARMRELQREVLEHVQSEERDVFPRLRASMSAEQLRETTQLVAREMAIV